MNKKIFGASYQRGVELAAGGCPLDFPDALPNRWAARPALRAHQLANFQSRVEILGPGHNKYLIGLRVMTDRRSGIVIMDWNLEPPWPGNICFDYEAEGMISERELADHKQLVNYSLSNILNDRRRLRLGPAVAGLLCGYSYSPIPEPAASTAFAKLTLVDETGTQVALRIRLAVIRAAVKPVKDVRRSSTILMRVLASSVELD